MGAPSGPPRPIEELASELSAEHPEPYASLRRDALTILSAGLDAVEPGSRLADVLSDDGVLAAGEVHFELGTGENVHVLAVGKASPALARVAHDRLPDASGLVVATEPGTLGDWTWLVGEHPVPGEGSLEAGEAAYQLACDVAPDETLLVLMSGGASAMVERPAVPFDDLALTMSLLLAGGVTIHELNVVRKHLSEIKGGHLAAACQGRVVTLAISDVPHDDPSTIGSGPTVPDPSSHAQAIAILERVGIDNFPQTVVDRLTRGAEGEVPDTPGTEAETGPVHFHLLATNRTALAAAEAKARELGHDPLVLPSPLEGEARVVGESLAKRLASEPRAILAGGETTVTLVPDHDGGPGLGGRNQELTLAAAINLRDIPAVVCGFGTDGVDGPTDAAGAIADGRTFSRGLEAKRDPEQYLATNDAYGFFAALGDLVRTGPTGTNVMDLFVGLVADEP